MQWWGPRAQNIGNPCAKVIFLVFFVFSSVRNSEKCEKAMKFQSPFNFTHKSKTVIFIATRRSTCENRGFSRIALELTWSAFWRFSGSLKEGKGTPEEGPAVPCEISERCPKPPFSLLYKHESVCGKTINGHGFLGKTQFSLLY